MRRRHAVAVVACALALPRALAQRRPLPRVAFLGSNEAFTRPHLESFRKGLREAGQVEGRTLELVVRYRQPNETLAAAIRDVVAQRFDVIVLGGLTAARLAREATSTIPIVVGTASDLVDGGVVKSFARPGGNITGVSDLVDVAVVKRLELLKEALPHAQRVALLVNPDFPTTPKIEARVGDAAPRLGLAIDTLRARDVDEAARALDGVAKTRPDALLVGADPLFNTEEFMQRASATRVPIIHYWQGTIELGALISYEVDVIDNWRRAAGYVDRILKGAKPADLPIYQPTRYRLLVNEKVARDLGIALPEALVRRADERM
jgi:putative ABC transport system substrate-binding protein